MKEALKEARKPKRFLYVVFVLAAALIFFATNATAFEGSNARVWLIDGDDGREVPVVILGGTVADLLEYEEIVLSHQDIVVPDLTTPLEREMTITINRAIPVFVRIDGSRHLIDALARPGSNFVQFVAEYRNHTGLDFEFDTDLWTTQLTPGTIISLRSNIAEYFEEQFDIEFEIEYRDDNELPLGEYAVYTEGQQGERVVTTRVRHIGGEEVERDIVSDEVVTSPINHVVLVGTFEPPAPPPLVEDIEEEEEQVEEPEELYVPAAAPLIPGAGQHISADGVIFNYSRALTMEATAYTLEFCCVGTRPGDRNHGITASGLRAAVGVVAVDTNVIPFHTRLYIEGYGFAVAGDRGGAIRGNKVDLFMDSLADARRFGRRNVRVWILED
ncbi:MAG: G5 domain-containing protein [Defluviitaleaceae bacterium]|nr:G5 domain-containing protein [Defluviitaleaceae bacterium]